MASWTLPYRVEAVDRDPAFYWQDLDDNPGDLSNDFFGQFINFDSDVATSLADHHGNPTLPILPNSLLLDQPAESTASSGVSTTEDDFDFLSSSSQAGAPMSVASAPREIDPQQLTLGGEHDFKAQSQVHAYERASMSDPELPRDLDRISLHSSPRKHVPISHPSSPTPPSTQARKPNKFVEALSSTIRKASKLRKPSRKNLVAMDRPGSPTMDHPPRALRQPPPEYTTAPEPYQTSPPMKPDPNFIHGYCEDPFSEAQQPPPHASMRFFSHNGLQTPADSPVVPVVKPEPGNYPPEMISNQVPPANWNQHPMVAQVPDQHWHHPEYVAHPDGGWWDLNLLNQNGEYIDQQKNAHMNMAMHAQHAELPYEYRHVQQDDGAAGLMIHMPQPRPGQPPMVHDISVNGPTYLPPPVPPIPPTERQHRPPRAPSSGARHLSCSPIRRQRAPPASPSTAHSRHSSGGSAHSARSASGRGMVPGTPTTTRKQRRSRETSGEVGFVNFTPSDGGLLMTGVAPSGSSKTKARREREAMERRRRLSEAALKAVQAAGGDVEKLREQGFAV